MAIGTALMNRWDLTTGALQGYGVDGSQVNFSFGTSLTDVILKAAGNNQTWGLFKNGSITAAVMETLTDYIDVEIGIPSDAKELAKISPNCYSVLSAIWGASDIAAGVRYDVRVGAIATHWNSKSNESTKAEKLGLDYRLGNLGRTEKTYGNIFFGLYRTPRSGGSSGGGRGGGGGSGGPSAPGRGGGRRNGPQ
jgi:hypothetical protein